jgi:hypothetical protein
VLGGWRGHPQVPWTTNAIARVQFQFLIPPGSSERCEARCRNSRSGGPRTHMGSIRTPLDFGSLECAPDDRLREAIQTPSFPDAQLRIVDGASAPDLRCAIAHRGISRFRVRCFASPRNDGASHRPTTSRHTPRKRSIQYAAAFRFHHWRLGILDRPPEPVIGRRKAPTRWQAMTATSVAQSYSSNAASRPRDAMRPSR